MNNEESNATLNAATAGETGRPAERRTRPFARLVGFVAWLVVMSALSIGVVPVGGTAPADAAACDADGDGVSGGSTSVELLTGSDPLVVNAGLGDPGDGYRWQVTVCSETVDGELFERLAGSASKVLAPEAAYWQVSALGGALDGIRSQTRAPVLRVWPEPDGKQVVGLETWLAIDPVLSAWRTLTASATFGEVTVTATAVPDSVVWEFSDGIVRCDSPGVEYTPGASGPAPCGKDWEHTSEVVPQQLRVWVDYAVTWSSSIGQSGALWSFLSGTNYGPRPLRVGEVQTIGVWGDRERPADPGVGPALDQDDPADCSLMEFALGECFSQPDDGCHMTWKVWNVAADCVGEVVGVVVDIGEWVVDQGWELFYRSLPAPIREAVDQILSFLAGCAEYGIEALSGFKDMIQMALSAASDPLGFLREQLALAKEIYGAIQEDAEAFAKEFFGDLIEYDLLQSNPAMWAGKVGCEIAVGLLTAGGAAAAGRFAKVFDKIDEFTDAIRDWRRRRRNGDDDSDSDGQPWICDNSFPTGTPVLMANGSLRPIELVDAGDRVVTFDLVSGRWRDQVVLRQWGVVHDAAMATAVIGDGSSITATSDHLFWVDSEGAWVELDDVEPGDHLLSPDGVTTVTDVSLSVPIHQPVVWELDVDIDDNFLVSTGTTLLLVHNCGPSRTQIDDMLANDPDLAALPKTSPDDILAAWERYDGDLTADEWLDRYAVVRKNNTGGSQFELDGLDSLGLSGDKTMYTSVDGVDFIPDHSEVLEDGTLYFAEVKNYTATTLQPSSNAGEMIRYLIDEGGGKFDLVINDDTVLSDSFQALITQAQENGVEISVIRRPAG